MMKKNASRRDHAVSPVVGVMLMLVVTIIIAAVVSAFAGGMMKSQDKTPQTHYFGNLQPVNGAINLPRRWRPGCTFHGHVYNHTVCPLRERRGKVCLAY